MFGVINVTETVTTARDLGASLDTIFVAQGWGAYTSYGIAAIIGPVLIAVNMICLVLAIGFAVPRLRTHRIAFWIPVVCAAVSVLLSVVLVGIAVAADPAGAAALMKPPTTAP